MSWREDTAKEYVNSMSDDEVISVMKSKKYDEYVESNLDLAIALLDRFNTIKPKSSTTKAQKVRDDNSILNR